MNPSTESVVQAIDFSITYAVMNKDPVTAMQRTNFSITYAVMNRPSPIF